MTEHNEAPEIRLKRLRMRSMRRGMKEMDIILSAFAAQELEKLSEKDIALYDEMLGENDQELYTWVTGQADPVDKYRQLILKVRSTAFHS